MNSLPYRQMLAAIMAAMTLIIFSQRAHAHSQHYTLTTATGMTLAVQEAGDPAGTPILFVHGLLGSRLSWLAQLQAPELQHHRLIAYDLRGHGLSAKPEDARSYTDGAQWAEDLKTVIDSLGARKPVLVGWSLGAAVISNYLAAYGDDHISGVVYAGAVIELNAEQIWAHPEIYRDMTATDLKTHLEGERAFLRLCFQQQPSPSTFQLLLANAAMASWTMQSAVPAMTIAAKEGLSKIQVPLLLIYGAQDALVNASASTQAAKRFNTDIRSTVYAGSGHAPFLEEADRFNRDLLDFIQVLHHQPDRSASQQPG